MEGKPGTQTLLRIIICDLKSFAIKELKKYDRIKNSASIETSIEKPVQSLWNRWNTKPNATVHDLTIIIEDKLKHDLWIYILSGCEDEGSIWVDKTRIGSLFDIGAIDKLKSYISDWIRKKSNEPILQS